LESYFTCPGHRDRFPGGPDAAYAAYIVRTRVSAFLRPLDVIENGLLEHQSIVGDHDTAAGDMPSALRVSWPPLAPIAG
jgi:hypothetical protein